MKLSSKSILSPSRTEKQISLSASLSRRLKTNGSLKGGGQSPMLFSTNKKRGSGFDTNTEPTSPKVTCIGQVRVKSKKKQQQKHHQGMKMRSLSRRKTGEVSFRRTESKKDQILITQDGLIHRNQKWVHLPLTICEVLKGFGSDFNCFSSCLDKEKNNQNRCSSKSSYSCGDVFGRWFVSLEGKEGSDIELVVGDEIEHENKEEEVMHRKSFRKRRNVMEDIDIDEIEKCNEERFAVLYEDNQNDEKRVNICVPPKNALLLMRGRSDPLKMAALANRFWESPLVDDDEDEEKVQKAKEIIEGKHEMNQDIAEDEIERNHEHNLDVGENLAKAHHEDDLGVLNENVTEEESLESVHEEIDNLVSVDCCSSEILVNLETIDPIEATNVEYIRQDNDNGDTDDHDENEMRRLSQDSYVSVSMLFLQSSEELSEQDHELEKQEAETDTSKNVIERNSSETGSDRDSDEQVPEFETDKNQYCVNNLETETKTETETEASAAPIAAAPARLPDSLLLMMCEPKLSMEVSKETWVCSTDFIKCLPPQQKTEKKKVNKINGGDQLKKRFSIDKNPGYSTQNHSLQPARSSCSFPLPSPVPTITMGMMVENKIGKLAAAYEPFGLKRCKSEPMRKSAKFAAPEGCSWKDKKLEPHRGATGVGC